MKSTKTEKNDKNNNCEALFYRRGEMKIVMLGEVPLPEEHKGYSTNYRMSVQHYYSPWIVNLLFGLNEILNEGDELHLLCNKICLKKEIHFKKGKINYHFLPMPKSLPKLGFLELYLRRKRNLQHLINEIDPDIVHGHGTEREYGLTSVSCNYLSLLTIHGLLKEVYRTNEGIYGIRNKINLSIRKQFENVTLRRGRNFIFITPWVENVIRGKYVVKNGFNIFNPVAPAFFDVQKEWGSKRIVYIGRINKLKGLTDLIRGMAIVVQEDANITLDIYGHCEDDYADYINRFIKDNNVASHVKMHGFMSNDRLPEVLSSSELLVIPSFMENCPMVVLEAMATGTPVIATNKGGIPFIVDDGKTGFLFEYADVERLAELILKITNSHDLKIMLSNNAREKASKDFHPVEVAKKHYAAFNDIEKYNA
ncbi:MAG: glycosyltransferase family 1 protein [Nitrospiraceae bacterium]|nr:MAG: glycosyltransferase family 1 protein [Nitrospiraceae bacterium]